MRDGAWADKNQFHKEKNGSDDQIKTLTELSTNCRGFPVFRRTIARQVLRSGT